MRMCVAFIFGLLSTSLACAQDRSVEVDLELVLMADVSRSMSPAELEIQRRGYAEALGSDAVFNAIGGGMLGRIALSYVEWAGSQHVVVDWALIETREDLDDFATELIVTYNPGLRRTSIADAIDLGVYMLENNQFEGLRKVIDVSGDGPNNAGGRVAVARDRAISRGVTINGLPLLTHGGDFDEWYMAGLDIYYQSCVIGGPGAFVLPVNDWPGFATAVRRKLVMEIAGMSPAPERLFRAQVSPHDPTDCLIGEKIWAQRQRIRDFGTP
jgi:hypothetical protein